MENEYDDFRYERICSCDKPDPLTFVELDGSGLTVCICKSCSAFMPEPTAIY